MDPKERVAYLMAVDNGKFRKPVVPGDQLRLEVEVVKHKGAVWKTKGQAVVDGNKVAEGEFLATVVERAVTVAQP
jgi:3-hydroxyacyl-[acyl-carrier-protein] dehydratase